MRNGGTLLLPVAAIWLLYLALIAVRTALIDFPHPVPLIERHGVAAAAGAALTLPLLGTLRLAASRPVAARAVIVMACAVAPAALLALINYNVMFVWNPTELWSARYLRTMSLPLVAGQTVVENYFLFLASVTLAASIRSALAAGEAGRRAAVAESSARDAQLRALHYQLNPHFIFNALNTISALVLRGDPEAAEQVIASLADLLRSTLTIDPTADLALSEELELQRLYLAIERVRYGERLRVCVDVPAELQAARVPALLLQPLVENVIRHGVGGSLAPVTLRIGAAVAGGTLRIAVQDDAAATAATKGVGIGLANVRARLLARFGTDATCRWAPLVGGGFRVEIALPLLAGECA